MSEKSVSPANCIPINFTLLYFIASLPPIVTVSETKSPCQFVSKFVPAISVYVSLNIDFTLAASSVGVGAAVVGSVTPPVAAP